jgi:hypothetical protein
MRKRKLGRARLLTAALETAACAGAAIFDPARSSPTEAYGMCCPEMRD